MPGSIPASPGQVTANSQAPLLVPAGNFSTREIYPEHGGLLPGVPCAWPECSLSSNSASGMRIHTFSPLIYFSDFSHFLSLFYSKSTLRLPYSDVIFKKRTALEEVSGAGTAIHNPVHFSQPWGQRENGDWKVRVKGRTWCEIQAQLSQVSPLPAQNTLEVLLPPLYLWPKLRLMKSGLSSDS